MIDLPAEVPPSPPGPTCAACGAGLRDGARFCAACGAERGASVTAAAIARADEDDHGLVIALGTYFVCLTPLLVLIARGGPRSLGEESAVEWVCGAAGVIGMLALGRRALSCLRFGRYSIVGAALAIGATAAVFGLVELYLLAAPSWFLDLDALMREHGLGLGGAVVHVAVLPAVTEELAFRGAVLGGLRPMLGDRTAIVASALCFAILHLSMLSIVHLSLLGVVLGTVRVRSGSVWPCMLLHASYNAALVILHW